MLGNRRLRELGFSYLGQGANLLAGAALLPLILYFLDEQQFVAWSVFAALAGVLLQCEAAIQATVNRRIAAVGVSHANLRRRAYRLGRTIFRRYALFAICFLLPVGGIYLLGAMPDGQSLLEEWAIYVAFFALSYAFGHNAALLVGLERSATLNINNMTSRFVNLAAVWGLLWLWRDLWALVIGFGVAVVLSVVLNQHSANSLLDSVGGQDYQRRLTEDERELLRFSRAGLVFYGLFLALSFWFYRSLLLIDIAASSDLADVATLALALQLFALGMAVAMVPVNMRVVPIVQYLATDKAAAAIEFARLHSLSLGGLVLFAGLLATLGLLPLKEMGASVAWPPISLLACLLVAFSIEISLQAMASVLILQRDFAFVRAYLISALAAMIAGLAISWGYGSIPLAILTMAAIQGTIALPLVFRHFTKYIALRSNAYTTALHLLWR